MLPNMIQIGTAIAKKGEFKRGIIKGIELNTTTSIDIPVLVMNGMQEGPTLLVVSTQHGIEVQGIGVIHEIMRKKLNPKTLNGAVVGIPVENPLAYLHHQYLSWIDNLDLGGGGSSSLVTVDNPNGKATERLANVLWNEAWKKADLVINIHCNTRPDSLIYQAIDVGNPRTKEKLWKMANAFGVTNIVYNTPFREDAPATLGNLASKKGVPVLLMELIDGRWISEPSTTTGVKGVLNIMKTFNMIDGAIEPQEGFPIIAGVNRFHSMVRANRGGIIRFLKKPGEFIQKDDVFAEIYNLYGDVIEQVKMPTNGYTWSYPCGNVLGTSGGLQTVHTGADIAYVFTNENE